MFYCHVLNTTKFGTQYMYCVYLLLWFMTDSFFLSFTFSCVYVFALGTTGEGSSYCEDETGAKRPLTEEEKLEQVKRSECTHHNSITVCEHKFGARSQK